jgi:hypothetical protein
MQTLILEIKTLIYHIELKLSEQIKEIGAENKGLLDSIINKKLNLLEKELAIIDFENKIFMEIFEKENKISKKDIILVLELYKKKLILLINLLYKHKQKDNLKNINKVLEELENELEIYEQTKDLFKFIRLIKVKNLDLSILEPAEIQKLYYSVLKDIKNSELSSEIINLFKFKKTKKHNILYTRISNKISDFFSGKTKISEFNKNFVGDDINEPTRNILLSGGFLGNLMIRILNEKEYKTWKKAYLSELWKKNGFKYVPIENMYYKNLNQKTVEFNSKKYGSRFLEQILDFGVLKVILEQKY